MNLLIDSALKATLILLAAWTASRLLRRASADVRHLIWLMATLAVAALPAILSIPQSAIPAAARIIVPANLVPAAIASAPQVTRKLPWLAIMWAAGASIVLARLIVGLLAAARITRSASNVAGTLYSDRAATPLTWGFLRPVVILPAYALDWTAQERDLVINHERAHIARRDWLWQILSSVTTAIFWFHPLVWLANLQLRREAESAVDDCVLANGTVPSDYADRLLDVARHLQTRQAPVAMIAMISRPELETRVRSILDPTRRRSTAGFLVRAAIAGTALALIFPIAAVHAQSQVNHVGKGVSQPSIIRKVEPEYTQQAKDDHIEGPVALKAEVWPDGMAHNIRVTKSLDPGLDANAVSAVSQWRFKPGIKDGEPVAVFVSIEVYFHLK